MPEVTVGVRVEDGVNMVLVVPAVWTLRAGVLSVLTVAVDRTGEMFREFCGSATRGRVGDCCTVMELISVGSLGRAILGSSGTLNTNSSRSVTVGRRVCRAGGNMLPLIGLQTKLG